MSLLFRWRNRIAVLALVVGVVLVVHASARQTTFYIDSANPKCTPGAGPGTQATPYCSMAYAATIANPGDTFLVSGPKHGSAPVTFTRPGTAANPITWRAVGTVAVGGFIDIDDATLVPTGLPNVWQIPWSATTGKTWQTHYADILVDDPNQSRFILKSSDGPLQLTPVLTEAEVAAHDGAYFRDAANQRLLIHPYGDRIPSTANTDFVVGVGNSFQADTKANYQVFDGFTVTYTAGTSGTVTSNNNRYLNMHYVGNPLNVSGDNNYFENITINNGIFRGPPLWIWYTDGEGATGGFSSGSTGNTMKNLHVFNSWNATFNSEGATNNVIDGARFHGAPNHCTGTSNGNNIVRNAAWWNCQDFQWLFDPTGIVMEHVVIPGGGLAVSAAAGNTGPITIRNSIFTGTMHFVRGTGDAAGLPYEGCTWESGSLMEYNVISDLATIERCDTQIAYPIDEYVARCASGEFTGCMTIRNNIKIPVSTGGPDAWKKVMVDGMWRAMSDGKGGWIEETGENWNFRLVPGSVAINAGMVSGTLIDLFGMSRPQPVGGIYDIGAHEFSPGGDPAPTGKPIVAAPAAVTTTITAPTASATYDAGTAATLTTLAGTSKSGRTMTGCTWTNSLGGSGNTSGATSWTVPSIALTVGSNVITVTCTNDGKTTGADVITVTRASGGGSACSGTCYYIRDGGTASVSGTGACVSTGSGSWATGNACDTFPATLVRGATYYVATGVYNSPIWTTAVSGTTLITVKGAIASDHGSDTGWSAAMGVDVTQAEFIFGTSNANYGPLIETSYFTFDGNTGSGSTMASYGFKVRPPASCPTNMTGGVFVGILSSTTTTTDVTVKHVAVQGCDPLVHDVEGNAFQVCGSPGYCSNITIANNYGQNIVKFMQASSMANSIVERNFIRSVGTNFSGHAEIISLNNCHSSDGGNCAGHTTQCTQGECSSNNTVRYNWFGGLVGASLTGGLVVLDGNMKGWKDGKIYGNVFIGCAGGNGCIATGTSGGVAMGPNIKVYNNTFVGTADGKVWWQCAATATCAAISAGGSEWKNNLFYQNTPGADDGTAQGGPSVTRDYNTYFSVVGSQSIPSGTNQQTGSSNPFVSYSATCCAGNYHLANGTTVNPGVSLGAPYNVDPDGNTRGADGTWDRGAYEFVAPPPPVPAPAMAWLQLAQDWIRAQTRRP